MNLFNTLLDGLVDRVAAIGAAAISAALLAYFRTEVSAAIRWVLSPLAHLVPWHRQAPRHRVEPQQALRSELTVADLFLITIDGKTAIYRKTADYVIGSEPLMFYHEGVTAAGRASEFSTELGSVTQTETEHGFSISTIEFPAAVASGTRFRNVFRAKLTDSFLSNIEHWTQEIAISTQRLILRVHFPSERPPISIRSGKLIGLIETKLITGAEITKLSGQPSITWEIERPKLGDIYKLEWRW